MYLRNDGFSGYNRAGEQIRQRGLFLLFIQPPGVKGGDSPIKAIVRKVALRQFGAWMMGKARVYNHSIVVSGTYGSDGLPCSVPQAVYDRIATELPADLVALWNKGGGHNSAGSEAGAIRDWAIENLDVLTD